MFGQVLRYDNILRNYDQYQEFEHIISARQMQDMKSVYVDIREQSINQKDNGDGIQIDFSDIEFEIDLLKTDEINLDYILQLILEKSKDNEDKETIKVDVRRALKSSLENRYKEDLVIKYIDTTNLNDLKNNDEIVDSFYKFARGEKKKEINSLAEAENLKDGAHRFIENAIQKGQVENVGKELDDLLPPVSRIGGGRQAKKQSVLEKIRKIVEIFIGI